MGIYLRLKTWTLGFKNRSGQLSMNDVKKGWFDLLSDSFTRPRFQKFAEIGDII